MPYRLSSLQVFYLENTTIENLFFITLLNSKNMAFKVHQVKHYNYAFDARTGGPGRLQLWSDNGKVAEVRFVDHTTTVPAPVISADLNFTTIYFKRSVHQSLIDMLRNEHPVSVTINNQGPGFVFVHTGIEPVGEGEDNG
jgi:hypothetical protein